MGNHRKHIVTPDIKRAVLERALALTTARVIQAKHALAEAHGSHQAQAAINLMLGPPVPLQGVVTKGDYVGQATAQNIRAAKTTLDVGADYKISKIAPDLHNNVKLQSGGFVYGTLKNNVWDVFYQATVAVTGTAVKKGLFDRGSKPLINEEVVLGPPTQIF